MKSNPDVLLLDEPTNDLDIETLEWLEKFIIQIDKPLIFISHDEKLLEKTTQIAKKQRAVQKKRKQKLQQIYEKVEHQQETISRKDPHGAKLLKKKMKSLKSQEKRFAKEENRFLDFYETEEAIKLWFADQPVKRKRVILELDEEQFLVHDKVIKEIKLEINSSEKIVIIGENGVGKTTLLKHCYEKIEKNPHIKVGYMPQNYTY